MIDPIETRIRQHYCAENGEWIVEKGKVKEAKLLKEACEAIEKLRGQYTTSERNYYRIITDTSKKERDLADREKAIAEREEKFESRKASFIRDLEKWV